jgi:hypothetical protein
MLPRTLATDHPTARLAGLLPPAKVLRPNDLFVISHGGESDDKRTWSKRNMIAQQRCAFQK